MLFLLVFFHGVMSRHVCWCFVWHYFWGYVFLNLILLNRILGMETSVF